MMPDAPTMLMVMGFTLIAISSGIVFLERRWVVGTLAVIIGGWSLVLALNGQSVPWNHYTYIYVMTTLFTLFNYSGRKRAVAAMVDAQVNNELQRNQLVDALERAHLSEARLRAERDFADQIVKSVGQGVVLLDANGRIEFMNPAAERIIQLPAALLIGRRVADLFSPDSNDTGVHFEFDGENSQELTITFANGEVRSALVSSTSQPGGGNIVTLTDLTLRKQFESKLERLAHYDALTDLPNRALFLDRLRQAINWLARHDGLLAVMFLDLDGFKRINDTLGHAVGDQVLVEVARRIEQCTREQDTAARFGGDEFVVLLTDLDDADEAHRIAARLAESISAPIVLEGELYVIEASIGVALCHAANVEPEDLIERADIAMYRSKHRGDARWQIFTPDMLPGKPAAGSLDLDSRRPIVART
jgi:diguanylate cyclase (GGDEF)-like protein/PAS domain S-box-containing protein